MIQLAHKQETEWKYITTTGLALEVFYEVDFCEWTSMTNLGGKFLQSQQFFTPSQGKCSAFDIAYQTMKHV